MINANTNTIELADEELEQVVGGCGGQGDPNSGRHHGHGGHCGQGGQGQQHGVFYSNQTYDLEESLSLKTSSTEFYQF